ncbi:MAG TPA: ATP-binding protein [Ktedonobacteraceae bacterium]|nr:ATP-binding protein [Ktedonobacteraceae bacterium]
MLEPDRIAYYFSLTHELPEVEFKGLGMRGDNPLFGRVVRAAMAMANRRGGGTVIIGVKEEQAGLDFKGLTADMLATWKYEHIANGFNSYTNVPIEFDHLEYEYNGDKFLVLDIHEFATVPVMCMKEYRDKTNPKMPYDQCKVILRPGAFYIRTINNAESKEMLTSEETRTLFQLANDKAVQSFVTHTRLAGINIAPLPKDEELFARQLEGWTGTVYDKIRTRGYWDIRIRPATFKPDRMPLFALRQLIMRASLDYRNWEFPYNTPVKPEYGNDWIGLEHQRRQALQAWRFFQSGQFAAVVGLLEDWGDLRTTPTKVEWNPGEYLSIPDVVHHLTEFFGLASRLAVTDLYRDEQSVIIDLKLCKTKNRKLYGRGTYQDFLGSDYPTAAENIPYTITLAKEDIIGRPLELAREASLFFFDRFGYYPSQQLLTTMQYELEIHT